MRRPSATHIASSLTLLFSAQQVAAQGAAMFRGNLAHTGVYEGAGITQAPQIIWTFHTAGRVISSPAIVAGTAYVGSTDGALYAVDAATGAQRWKFETQGRITSSPAVDNGTVYFLSYDSNFYALDAATGALRWKFATRGERRFTGTHLHGAIPKGEAMPDPFDVYLSSPSVWNGAVYFGSGDGNVYALNVATGQLRWKFHTSDVVHASPAIADGMVFIGSWDSWFYALNASTGKMKWRFKTGVDPDIHNQVGIPSSAAIVDGTVYFGCRDGHLYALDERTGAKRWAFNTKRAWVTASPAMLDGKVYFGAGSSHMFFAADARTGAQLFSATFTRGLFASPAISGNVLYNGGFDGTLTAIDLVTQKEIWSFQTEAARVGSEEYMKSGGVLPGPDSAENGFYDKMMINWTRGMTGSILSSPVVVDGVIYLGSADGNLYALK